MTKKILIVGPGGFLASHLISKIEGTAKLIGLANKTRPNRSLETFNEVSELKGVYPEFDTIYLLGSYVPYGAFHLPSQELIKSNVELPARLALLYPDSRVIFSSSASVYGKPRELPVSLNTPFNDPDQYGLSKLAGEAIVRNQSSYAVIRFSSIIGKGMKPVTMIPRMIKSAKAGKVTVFGNGDRLQNYIDVRDAAEMCIKAADSMDNLVILGTGEKSVSNLEVARHIQSRTNCSLEFSGEDTSPSFVYDAEDSFCMINFRPKYSIQQSLDSMID